MESGPIVGAIVGGLIGYFSAYAMSIRLARIKAGGKLRAAFAPEIAQMRLLDNGAEMDANDKKIDCEKMLVSAFPRHAAAIEEFSSYLSIQQREKYYKAWREYYYVDGVGIRFFNYYMGKGKEPYKLFFNRIEAILQFTEEVEILRYFKEKIGTLTSTNFL